MDDRKRREKTLQDQRFGINAGSRGGVDKAYGITYASHGYFRERLCADAAGKRLLEIGSGGGENVLALCANGARATGIDLSDVAVKLATTTAKERGILTADFHAMDAEEMTFPDHSFDIVCGGAILHHLALERALPEIARVLDPAGYALFIEPLGYNPFINMYRRLTPKQRTPDEHPLLQSDLAALRRHFGTVNIRYYYLTTLLALPVASRAFARPVIDALNRLDVALFRVAPMLRRYAWIIVIELREPL